MQIRVAADPRKKLQGLPHCVRSQKSVRVFSRQKAKGFKGIAAHRSASGITQHIHAGAAYGQSAGSLCEQGHTAPALRGGQGRSQARQPAADHQHINRLQNPGIDGPAEFYFPQLRSP